jgi:hypothetical protein
MWPTRASKALRILFALLISCRADKCCYTSTKDCDGAKDFCSKSVKDCTECNGFLVDDEGSRVQSDSNSSSASISLSESKDALADSTDMSEGEDADTSTDSTDKSERDEPSIDEATMTDGFPINLASQQCYGMTKASANSQEECENYCTSKGHCAVWQWCPQGEKCSPTRSCWVGLQTSAPKCKYISGSGWVSRARSQPTNEALVATMHNSLDGRLAVSISLLTASFIFFFVAIGLRIQSTDLSRPLLN